MITENKNFANLVVKTMTSFEKDLSKGTEVHPDLAIAKGTKTAARKGYPQLLKYFSKLDSDDKLLVAAEIQHYTRQNKKTIEKMLKFKWSDIEDIDFKSFKDVTEIAMKVKGATFTFGRFNPPTVGHMKLALSMKAVSGGDDILIYTSHTKDKQKNPLTNTQIRKFMNPMLPRGINVVSSNAKTIFDVAVDIYNKGYNSIRMVVGSDRVKEFETLLNRYNGANTKFGTYNFSKISVVSAGERDPDAKGVAGMSASKMRQFVHAGQRDEFLNALPKGYRLGAQLYKAVQKGMGIKETFPDFMYEIYDTSKHEWGTDAGREYVQDFTPYQPVVKWVKRSVKEADDLPKDVLAYKEKMYKELKKERDDFVKRYGDRADEVMHGTAMQMAKRKYGYNT